MTRENEENEMTQLYTAGRIFTADTRPWATAMAVQGDRLLYVGDDDTARRIAGDAEETDLGGALVVPGFVDGHAHIVETGAAADQIDLWSAADLADIQHRLAEGAAARPDAARVRAQGWQHAATGTPQRRMLDEIVPDRPVYVQAHDLHSMWLNTAALAEVGIDDDTESPAGGSIHRDADGHATGLIDETAMQQIVWPALDRFASDAEDDAAVRAALRGYAATGVTASTDMALSEPQLAALKRVRDAGELTARVAAHWLVHRTGDPAEHLAQVQRAAELAQDVDDDRLRVVGIKLIADGTVDGCTAAVRTPYANGALPDPVWSLDEITPVVVAADAAGLQVAIHAIGDEAVRIAITAIERAVAANGPRARRHRIEHLEVVDPEEIARLAALGITASMQPVHSDPAIQDNWRAMLGDERVQRGYPWPEMTEQGARLAFGTDSPTSPFAPLPNMFIAATRRSALNPALEPNLPRYALPLADAVAHATRDAAWASGAEDRYGRLAAGLSADFVVLDRDIFRVPVDELLEAGVRRTVVGGEVVYEAS
ncbi:amidohydrolase [Microbacterium elymi]|uniref:Amidohydrolase n=1 Tax=Microbacterium elymi TaxID=2909587 RepID=A0ABY5NIA8_9MICO|nr:MULTISPECIES: amidohydrolase [Microbacterium]UUT34905.1 amidohydrolase [Microbacterium elymi]